jgi:hypothetical protein
MWKKRDLAVTVTEKVLMSITLMQRRLAVRDGNNFKFDVFRRNLRVRHAKAGRLQRKHLRR